MPGDFDILSLAQQAGYLPSGGPATPATAPNSGPVTTPDDSGRQDPGAFIDQVHGIPTTATSQVKAKMSAESRGYSSDKMAQVRRDSDPWMAAQGRQAEAESNAAYAPLLDKFEEAAEAKKDAAERVTRTEHEGILEQGRQDQAIADLYTKGASDEARINEHYRAESNQAKADYMAALADYRSQRVDPNALWKSMSGGDRFGMLISAFVQDFLGAKGVHTSAMETFNKAIDRNIDAQVQNIKLKGEAAEGFKTLWEMQRSQASSDAEARARVRGFMLDGAKQAVVAHMAGFKAALSDAQGQAALAGIDEEQAKNMVGVMEHIDTGTLQRKQQALEKYKTDMSAAVETKRLAFEREKLDREHPTSTTPVDPRIGGVVDPFTNKYEYRLNPTIMAAKPDEVAKISEGVQKDLGKMASLDKRIQRLATLAEEAKSVTGKFDKTRFANNAQAEFDGLAKEIAGARDRDQDGRVNWDMIQATVSGLRKDMEGGQYSGKEIISQFRKRVLEGYLDQNKGLLVDLDPNDPARMFGGASKGGMFNTLTSVNADLNPATPSRPESVVQAAMTKVGSSEIPGQDTHQPIPDEAASPHLKTLVGEFRDKYPDVYNETKKFPGEDGKPGVGDQITSWEQGLTDLAEEAASSNPADRASAADAYKKLIEVAHPYLAGASNPHPKAVFAAMVLTDLHAQNPDLFSEDPDAKVPDKATAKDDPAPRPR